MLTIDEIRAKIERLLISTDGNPEPHEMALIIREARDAGIDDKQIARLVPDVDRAINWEAVRAEKAAAAAKAATAAASAKMQEDAIASATGHLDALITFCMADGSATTAELQAIFAKSAALQQSDIKTAGRIKAAFDAAEFRPFPNANLNEPGLKEVLLSTNWHSPERYIKITAAPAPSNTVVPLNASASAPKPEAAQPPPAMAERQKPVPLPIPRNTPVPQPPPKPFNPPKKKSSGIWWVLLVLVIPVFFVLKKEGILDLNLPGGGSEKEVKARTVAGSATLRSSMNANTQSNIIGDLQYGTAVIVQDTLGTWLRVKTAEDEGYVAASLTVNEADYQRLNSIFADDDSREAIPSTRYRLALLLYFKQHNYSGAMITEEGNAAPGSDEVGEQWEVKAKEGKPGTIFLGKITQPGGRSPDFGVIITQKATGKRRFLLFSFNAGGVATVTSEQPAPDKGNILSVTKKVSGGKVDYIVKYG